MKISVTPAWSFTSDQYGRIDPLLFALLNHLQADRRLTEAARQANISYRHAWNILKKWNQHFGQPLVIQNKGQGSHLTELGRKLLWAEQLIDAHLSPQIGTLTSTINKELSELMGKQQSMPRLHASHGYAVAALPALVSDVGKYSLEIKYMGSVEAVRSLNNGDCEIAGFHLCRHPVLKEQLSNEYQPYINSSDYVVTQMVMRNQGLIVQKNNPKNIFFLSDLIDPTIQYINRQQFSGTRILFDQLLSSCRINPKNITGYANEEFTHTAIAAHVASGAADVGFGIQYAAHKFDLDFIPVVNEQYVLACRTSDRNMAAVKHVLELVSSKDFAERVFQLPGYQLDSPGKQIAANKFLSEL